MHPPKQSANAAIWQAWAVKVDAMPDRIKRLEAVPDQYREAVRSHLITVRKLRAHAKKRGK